MLLFSESDTYIINCLNVHKLFKLFNYWNVSYINTHSNVYIYGLVCVFNVLLTVLIKSTCIHIWHRYIKSLYLRVIHVTWSQYLPELKPVKWIKNINLCVTATSLQVNSRQWLHTLLNFYRQYECNFTFETF